MPFSSRRVKWPLLALPPNRPPKRTTDALKTDPLTNWPSVQEHPLSPETSPEGRPEQDASDIRHRRLNVYAATTSTKDVVCLTS